MNNRKRTVSGMSEFSTYEYAVSEKKTVKLLLKKLCLLFIYFLFVVAWFIFGFVSKFFPLLALMPVTLWMLVFFTWRYVNVEYEYSMTSGDITFSKIYGNRQRKKVIEFKIKDCTLIAPFDKSEAKARDYSPEKVYYMLSDINAPSAYVALLEKDGKHIAVCFEATEKALKICRFYNAPATVIADVKK